MDNQQYKWRQRKKQNTQLIIWIVLIIILAAAATFAYEGMKESNPLNVAENYFKDAEGVTEYRTEAGSRSLNDNNQFVQEYTFTYTADGKEVSKKVNVLQQNEKKYGLFDQWTMAEVSQGTAELELIAPADSQVLVNGVAPDASEIKEDENLSPGAVSYDLKGIDAQNCKIQVTGLPFDAYEEVLESPGSVLDVRDKLVVGENAQTQMIEIAKTMINELFTAAAANREADSLGELFDNAPNKTNLYSAIVRNLYQDDVLQVESLGFENFVAEFGEVYYPGKEEDSYIGIEMKLAYDCIYTPLSGAEETEAETETETETAEGETEGSEEPGAQTGRSETKEATFYFRYKDGNCSVTSIEVPGVI